MEKKRHKPGPKPIPSNQNRARLYIEIDKGLKGRIDTCAKVNRLRIRAWLEPILERVVTEEIERLASDGRQL